MTDRIPLIINSSAQQIQELPSSDSLSFSLASGSASDPSLALGVSTAGIYAYSAEVIGLTFPGANNPWGIIGHEISGDTGEESIFIGSCARATPPKSPKNANNDSDAEGLQITSRGKINVSGFNARPMTLNRMGATDNTNNILLFNNNGTECGKVRIAGSTSVSYDTTSDYRLKENVVDLTGARARLDSLNVKRFNFIADPGITVDGFLAHEAQTVVPEAVSGSKDQIATQADVDADEANAVGDPIYQGIDQSKLVPLLTAALQEAFAEIDSLKARITALE
jgi:hypothetical protein